MQKESGSPIKIREVSFKLLICNSSESEYLKSLSTHHNKLKCYTKGPVNIIITFHVIPDLYIYILTTCSINSPQIVIILSVPHAILWHLFCNCSSKGHLPGPTSNYMHRGGSTLEFPSLPISIFWQSTRCQIFQVIASRQDLENWHHLSFHVFCCKVCQHTNVIRQNLLENLTCSHCLTNRKISTQKQQSLTLVAASKQVPTLLQSQVPIVLVSIIRNPEQAFNRQFLIMAQQYTKEELMTAFKQFDVDGNGTATRQELLSVLESKCGMSREKALSTLSVSFVFFCCWISSCYSNVRQ